MRPVCTSLPLDASLFLSIQSAGNISGFKLVSSKQLTWQPVSIFSYIENSIYSGSADLAAAGFAAARRATLLWANSRGCCLFVHPGVHSIRELLYAFFLTNTNEHAAKHLT